MADPTTVAGLRGRWRASTISSPPADGSALTTWTDTAGTPHDASQATAGNKPIYRSSGAFLPNSKPVVEFTAANSSFMTATVAQNTATTRFMVIQYKTIATSNQTSTSSLLTLGVTAAGKVVTSIENVTFLIDGTTGVTLSAGSWYVLTLADNGSNSDISYVNGTQNATSSTAHTLSGTSLTIGGKQTTGEYTNAYIAEILDYSAVLSATDRATVHSYIQDEYGITVSDYVSSLPIIVMPPRRA